MTLHQAINYALLVAVMVVSWRRVVLWRKRAEAERQERERLRHENAKLRLILSVDGMIRSHTTDPSRN